MNEFQNMKLVDMLPLWTECVSLGTKECNILTAATTQQQHIHTEKQTNPKKEEEKT